MQSLDRANDARAEELGVRAKKLPETAESQGGKGLGFFPGAIGRCEFSAAFERRVSSKHHCRHPCRRVGFRSAETCLEHAPVQTRQLVATVLREATRRIGRARQRVKVGLHAIIPARRRLFAAIASRAKSEPRVDRAGLQCLPCVRPPRPSHVSNCNLSRIAEQRERLASAPWRMVSFLRKAGGVVATAKSAPR